MRMPEILKVLVNRRSICWIRASYCVAGAINGTVTVPFGPAARLRPSNGAIWALVNTYWAYQSMPGRFWYVRATLNWYGRGTTPDNLPCVEAPQGGTISQNAFERGAVEPFGNAFPEVAT